MSNDNDVNLFGVVEWYCKLSGVWWPDENEKKIKRMGYILWNLGLLCLAVSYYICEFLKIEDALTDFKQIITYIAHLFTHNVAIAKLYILFVHRNKIKKIQCTLQDRLYIYESCESFQPGKVFNESKNILRKLLIFIFFVYNFIGCSAHVAALYALQHSEHEQYSQGNVTCNDFLPYLFVIPFPTPTEISCRIAFIYINVGICVWAMYILAYDAVYFSLLLCVKTKLQILREAIKTIRKRTLYKMNLPMSYEIFHDDDFPALEDKLYSEIRHCAKHLESLLSVCEEIENLLTYVNLGQMLTSLVTLASCLFISAHEEITSPKFLASSEYTLGIFIQLSILCYCGHAITDESSEISNSLYESEWISSSKRFKTCMLMMMIRVQKEVCLTVGKFTPLNLSMLVKVVKGAFSCYTLFTSVE